MNKNNWSNKFFSGNKSSPGKGKAPPRSPGSANNQDNFRKRPKDGQQAKNPKGKEGKKLAGLSTDEFMGAIDFGDESGNEQMDDGLPTEDQVLLSTTGAIQRLWQLHLTDPREKKMGYIMISNIALPCGEVEFNTIVVLMMKKLNLPDLSIKGPAVRIAKDNILPVTRLSVNFTDQEADRGWTVLPLPYDVLLEAMGKGDESGGATHHQRFWLMDEVQINNDPKNSSRRVAQKDPVLLQLVPDSFADVPRQLWNEVLIIRGVMSDSPGAAANSALVLLHAHIVRGEIEGLRPGGQLWPVVIAFPNKNPDRQSKSSWTVELMVTLFLIHRPYRVSTPKKRSAREMETGDEVDEVDEVDELGRPGDVGTVVQSDIQAVLKKFNIGSDERSVHLILSGWRMVVAPRLKRMMVTDLHYLAQPGYTQVITGLRQGLLPDYILGVLANNEVDLSHAQYIVMSRGIYRGKAAGATDTLYICSMRRPKTAIGDLQALRELGPLNSAGARADGLLVDVCMFQSNLAKYRRQLHLGDGYGDQHKIGLRPAELGVYVD